MGKLDVVIGSNAVSVARNGAEHIIVGLNDDGQLVIYLRDIDRYELIDELELLPDNDLEVNIRSLALDQLRELPTERPKTRPEVRAVDTSALRAERDEEEEETPKVKRVPRKRYSGEYESPLEEWERHKILEMVTESYMRFPDQDPKFTAEESHRIAKEVFGEDDHHHVMRVAGVRSALAKGLYDTTLEDIRQKARNVRGDAG